MTTDTEKAIQAIADKHGVDVDKVRNLVNSYAVHPLLPTLTKPALERRCEIVESWNRAQKWMVEC
jgi:hypothetical protein